MERYYHYYSENSNEMERASTNPSTPKRNSDVDFNDVFGGPPRRSSVNEMRDRLELSGESEEGPSCPWPPVFGGEDNNNSSSSNIGNRRRLYTNRKDSYFFDDIFGGDESPTPRKPFSGTCSPAPPLPLPVASSSLPPSFSLPAILTKGVELPSFGSPTRTMNPLNNINDGFGSSNGLGSPDSHLSRFSTQAAQRKEELKNDLKPSHRQSLLSQEFSNLNMSDKADKGSNVKQDPSITDVLPSTNNGQFHFSIYKWASKGVPLVMPLRAERNSSTKAKVKIESSSSKEWRISEFTSQNGSPIAYNSSSLTKTSKQDRSNTTTTTTTQDGADYHQIAEQIASVKAKSDTLSSLQTVVKDVPGSPISCDAREEPSTHSISEIGFSGKTDTASETQQDRYVMTRKERGEENKTKSTKKSSAILDVPVNPKKREGKTTSLLKGVEHSKATSQGSLSLGENMGKGRVEGKVKEFVRIFNQEAVTKPRVDSKSRLQDSTYKQRGALRTNNEVEGYPEHSKNNSATEITNVFANNISQQDDISASAFPDISFTVIGDKDGPFHGNFMIQVLAQDENEVFQNQEIQVLDSKIQLWSKGKEGNIRSLLSTLQYVLWPECGWKPVPLVDIIEGNAVKRAYQRALLCLHPDKLQQKGAASHQKYIAEKVFDILQEAWTQFNMLGAL